MENKVTPVLHVKKLQPNAHLPQYSSANAAGMDLYSLDTVSIHPMETKFIHTGIAIALPKNTVGLVYARSGLACKGGLAPANKVGVIDEDYRGEIMVALHNHSLEPYLVEDGMRIAQLVVTPYLHCDVLQLDELNETERGAGGFGSTGMN